MQLRRPGAPSIREKPFSGLAPIPRLCRRGPAPGVPSPAAVTCFGLDRRPPARPRPGAASFGQIHSLTSAISSKHGHTREQPHPAPERARERSPRRARASCPGEHRRRHGRRGVSLAGATRAPPCRPRLPSQLPLRGGEAGSTSSEHPMVTAASPTRSGETWVERCGLGRPPLPAPRRASNFEQPGCLPQSGKPTAPLG